MITNPYRIAPEAFVIPSYHQGPGAPSGVLMSSMVLRAAEPVVFDTGLELDRDDWFAALASIVDPIDVRWVVVTHDDPDHTGNLPAVLERCPNATIVTTWFMSERLQVSTPIPPTRMRWVQAGETLDVGDRELAFLRPPLYDNPTTRVIHDPESGVLWGADLFAAPVPAPIEDAEEVPFDQLAGGFQMFQWANCPWVEMVDRAAFARSVNQLADRPITAIASAHGPTFRGTMVDAAFDLLRAVPDGAAPDLPGQAVLDEIVASLLVPAG